MLAERRVTLFELHEEKTAVNLKETARLSVDNKQRSRMQVGRELLSNKYKMALLLSVS